MSSLTISFLLKLNWSFREWNNVWIKHDAIWQFYEVGYVEMSCGKEIHQERMCSPLGRRENKADIKPLDDFQTYLSLLEKLVARWKNNSFSLLRLVMKTRILVSKWFLSHKVLLGRWGYRDNSPKALSHPFVRLWQQHLVRGGWEDLSVVSLGAKC